MMGRFACVKVSCEIAEGVAVISSSVFLVSRTVFTCTQTRKHVDVFVTQMKATQNCGKMLLTQMGHEQRKALGRANSHEIPDASCQGGDRPRQTAQIQSKSSFLQSGGT